MIVLDNAESILDPQGTDAQDIYSVVEELSQFSNICLCITSRISTTPPDYKCLDVPTLSMEAARDTFYRIYDSGADRSIVVDSILENLDFHPLSITLLATVARQNKWDTSRLTREWELRRTGMLQTQHNKNLATTIELSLASPLFREFGPDARALLGIVAFFPQGIDENNLEWLFPTVPNKTSIFDGFCILSLTHRTNGFITMLAPLRDYLSPKDPKAFPLLYTIAEHYLTRMSIDIDPEMPSFGESRWIVSEDVNVEHLLDVFMTTEADSEGVWAACINFMEHLYYHKKRLTILKPKIEGLSDHHHSKPRCLVNLSWLFESLGKHTEQKQLLIRALDLRRAQGNDGEAAVVLVKLADVNQVIGLNKEGIQQAREASEIFERLNDTERLADCLIKLAWSLSSDDQLDAAEEAASRAINLPPEKGGQFKTSESHRVLGNIYRSKGDIEKAIHHYEVAIGIATPFGWHDNLFWLHYELAVLFRDEGRFDDAHAHIGHAKPHTANSTYRLGLATKLQAWVLHHQNRLEEARSEALRAADIFDQLGVVEDAECCRNLLRMIESGSVASGQSDFNCELPKILLFPARIDSSL